MPNTVAILETVLFSAADIRCEVQVGVYHIVSRLGRQGDHRKLPQRGLRRAPAANALDFLVTILCDFTCVLVYLVY